MRERLHVRRARRVPMETAGKNAGVSALLPMCLGVAARRGVWGCVCAWCACVW